MSKQKVVKGWEKRSIWVSPGWWRAPLLLLSAVTLSACEGESPAVDYRAPVQVMSVQPQNIDLLQQFTGEVSSQQEVELRSRVSGILLEKHFEDGSYVQQGDLLFTIDDRDLRAKLLEAEASLATAQSDYRRAKLDVERYEPLLKTQAISRQVYDNAETGMQSAKSRIDTAKATVEQARLAVEYASIESPVAGRIGAAEVDTGDLISAASTLLAKVSTVEMSRVDFSVSESTLIDYEKRHGNIDQQGHDKIVPARLYLSDGSAYPETGHINFSDRALNSNTGTIRMRADFPNPNGALRPGMFARVEVVIDQLSDVIAVPDRAVSQLLNTYTVTLVDEDDIARKVEVEVGRRQSGLWVIREGLEAGDRVVVEGIQKARDGAPVTVTSVVAASE
ncbi:efflux RND transporter periplasmic adaptor subunit [Parahaliea mediterranea]|uniref:efflux RND transporter periplasmic adaptor subunit n=1 Tax=Parahaliea mediterranea TaxID=651086 RepID=UPI000E2F56AE|nr:efflux RND transporter periplasmic adaptor subunit [Parahaliea mediterranea]